MSGADIRFDDVHLSYDGGAAPVLRGVDLTIPASDFCVLLGRSGMGKSTLLRCVNGLVSPQRGTVTVGGRTVRATDRRGLREVRSRVGVIFQSYNLVGRLTVIENVLTGMLPQMPVHRALPGIFTTAERDRAMALLDEVGLADHADRRADQLSGGQKQRVGIARALAQRPEVLLADEPIASLDPVTAAEILALLKSINEREGITVVLSLHQLEFARAYGERIIALLDGRVAIDTPPALLGEAEVARIYGSGAGLAATGSDSERPDSERAASDSERAASDSERAA